LLLQSQNKLDHLLGDLFGTVQSGDVTRWFAAEFKRDAASFPDELRTKKNRRELVDALYNVAADDDFRASKHAHLAVWLNDLGEVRWSFYVPTAAGTPSPGSWTFEDLYRGLHRTNAALDGSGKLYLKGAGVPRSTMREHLERMMQAESAAKGSQTNTASEADYLMFGVVAPGFVPQLVSVRFANLIARCNAIKSIVEQGTTPRRLTGLSSYYKIGQVSGAQRLT
jgi:hypothetical protein